MTRLPPNPQPSWQEASQQRLDAALEGLWQRLAGEGEGRVDDGMGDDGMGDDGLGEAPNEDAGPNALDQLVLRFGLSAFERDLLLLAAAAEVDGRFVERLGGRPTFARAAGHLDGAHWSALAPEGALRRGRLVTLGRPPENGGLVDRPVHIEEAVLLELLGLPQLDERLRPLLDPLSPSLAAGLLPSHWPTVRRLAATWAGEAGDPLPIAWIPSAGSPGTVRAVVAAAARALGWGAFVLDAARLAGLDPAEAEVQMDRWRRDAVLHSFVLLLELEAEPPASLETLARHWLARADGPLVLAADQPPGEAGGQRHGSDRHGGDRPILRLDLGSASVEEGSEHWRRVLASALEASAEAGALPVDDDFLDRLARQFPLAPGAIDEVVIESAARVALEAEENEGEIPAVETWQQSLWRGARRRARGGLDRLAQRLEPVAGWDDLVLPPAQAEILRSVAAHVRHRGRVYDDWGFADRSRRGLGIGALFSGPSGTGKTLAAEVLARELDLDLYRIDLSALVSKYIGETERNLRRLFDAAEQSGAILLFDEADSLFGKRSEVKDSHDRYANLEVSYLLQRVESYRGLAVLTTNFEKSVDTAFLRRLRFVVPFPFPAAAERRRIWERIFPSRTPTEGLELDRLAQLAVTGGSIRNIAMDAAFRAAERGGPVTMAELRRAARAELVKNDRPVPEAELRGWTA